MFGLNSQLPLLLSLFWRLQAAQGTPGTRPVQQPVQFSSVTFPVGLEITGRSTKAGGGGAAP